MGERAVQQDSVAHAERGGWGRKGGRGLAQGCSSIFGWGWG